MLKRSLRLVGDPFSARRLDQATLTRQRELLGQADPHTLMSAASHRDEEESRARILERLSLMHWALTIPPQGPFGPGSASTSTSQALRI